MNYELAKELKDAGFPQKGDGEWYCEMDSPAGGSRFELLDSPNPKKVGEEGYESIYAPTLSELIEAIGDIPFRLQSYYSGNDIEWQADTCGNFKDWNHVADTAALGSTPEEAVARLWLQLNKPK